MPFVSFGEWPTVAADTSALAFLKRVSADLPTGFFMVASVYSKAQSYLYVGYKANSDRLAALSIGLYNSKVLALKNENGSWMEVSLN